MLYLVAFASLLITSKSTVTVDCNACDNEPICCYTSTGTATPTMTQYANKCLAAGCSQSQWTTLTLPSQCGDCCTPGTSNCPITTVSCLDPSNGANPAASLGYCECPVSATPSLGYCMSDADCAVTGEKCMFNLGSANCGECTCVTCSGPGDCVPTNIPQGMKVTSACVPDGTGCYGCQYSDPVCDTINGWCSLSPGASDCGVGQKCQATTSTCGECVTDPCYGINECQVNNDCNTGSTTGECRPDTTSTIQCNKCFYQTPAPTQPPVETPCVNECTLNTVNNDCVASNVPQGMKVEPSCVQDAVTGCYVCQYEDPVCDTANGWCTVSTATSTTCDSSVETKICLALPTSAGTPGGECGECLPPCSFQECTSNSQCQLQVGTTVTNGQCVADVNDQYQCNICEYTTPLTCDILQSECADPSDCGSTTATGTYICVGATDIECGACVDCSNQECDTTAECNTGSAWTAVGNTDFICESDSTGCNSCKQTRCTDSTNGECLAANNCENGQVCTGVTYDACGTCADEPTTTSGDDDSCSDDGDCDTGYSCQFGTTTNCVPGSYSYTLTGSSSFNSAIATCEGVCVTDDEYCDPTATSANHASWRVAGATSAGLTVTDPTQSDLRGLCEFCLCAPNGETRPVCNYIDDILSWVWGISQDQFEEIFNVVCNYQMYEDLKYVDASGNTVQCPYEFVRPKATAQIENCWCDALTCEVVGQVGNGANKLGYMIGIGLVVALFSWM